ncbi:MAG: hypothetical protein Q8Q59_00065 [Luteolibacter sp.]|jgi:hypothetical protein|nr:hypothetical protein [Luteolibacter sp.]
MNPDEAKLALWLEDELHGEELAAFETWVAENPEHHAAREEARRWQAMMAAAVPATEDPPYPEFFNHRITRTIQELQPEPVPVSATGSGFSWRSLFMPLAACAGMMLAFWMGGKRQPGMPEIDVTGAPRAIPVEPVLYTPEGGVKAEWFTSLTASATVIVLDGVTAIPDATDFSKTAFLQQAREIDATADLNSEPLSNGQ